MQKTTTMFVGFDVHKDQIAVAYAPSDPGAGVALVGQIGPRLCDNDKLVRSLQSKASTLVFVYETRPCGYVLYRYLMGKQFECRVIVPSLIPKRSGD